MPWQDSRKRVVRCPACKGRYYVGTRPSPWVCKHCGAVRHAFRLKCGRPPGSQAEVIPTADRDARIAELASRAARGLPLFPRAERVG